MFHGDDDYDKRQLKAFKAYLRRRVDRSNLQIGERDTGKVNKLLEGVFGWKYETYDSKMAVDTSAIESQS